MTATDTTDVVATSTAPRLTGIQHVGLTVRNIDASVEWYIQVLGLERQFDETHHDSDQGGYAIVLGTPDMAFNLGIDHHPTNRDDGFDATRTGLDHICFQVADTDALAAWVQHLDQLGVANSGVYVMAGTPFRLVTFNDPDGIQLELIAHAG